MLPCDTCGGACCRFVVVAIGELTADQRRWAEMRGPVDFAYKGAFLWRLPVACQNLAEDGMCRIYASRPDVCREFEVGGELCKKARGYRGETKETDNGKA